MSEKENIQRLIENKQVQFRDFKITRAEALVDEDENEFLVIEGTPCVFDTETVLYKGKNYIFKEKIDRNAFTDADVSDVIFNFNHCGTVFARTRNGSLALSVDDEGLKMTAKLRKSSRNEEFYNDIKEGLIDKMSFAFTVKKEKFEVVDEENGISTELRTVLEIDKLYDVSAVDIPAYDTTSISARNAFDSAREKRKAESLKREKLKLKIKLKEF